MKEFAHRSQSKVESEVIVGLQTSTYRRTGPGEEDRTVQTPPRAQSCLCGLGNYTKTDESLLQIFRSHFWELVETSKSLLDIYIDVIVITSDVSPRPERE